ncbi:MAG: hypothetical protein LBQ24_05510 [Candidatus Peribacteria bacterium]|nr:hypothetical protein [Candidatus Peribacteria bacterium]
MFKNFQFSSSYFVLSHNLKSIFILATSHKSNLFSSKNVTLNNSSTLSSVAKSQGLISL